MQTTPTPHDHKIRCGWAGADPLYIRYHDTEWGLPVHDDRILFEFLLLEGAQAGLSWITILKKRQHYRKVFDDFDPGKIAVYDTDKVHLLLADRGIVRNKNKIRSAVDNAGAFLAVQEKFEGFHRYIWQFVNHTPIQNQWTDERDIPAETRESQAMSRDLKQKGFSFVGPKICYAFMQAVGMVNDHVVGCFRHREIRERSPQASDGSWTPPGIRRAET